MHVVDQDLIKNLLSKLISFPTVSEASNMEMIDYLDKLFSDLGFRNHKIINPQNSVQANLLCSIGPQKPEGLMLSGHTDVVPVLGQKWETDPFTLYDNGEKFFARGVADMKSFIVCAYAALKNLDLKDLKKPLSLFWTYQEENGCHGSRDASPKFKEFLGFLPSQAIIGEPTDFSIVRMHKGHVTLKIEFRGRGAHSSAPELGISAIKILHNSLTEIFLLEQDLKKEIYMKDFFSHPYIVMNVGEINGGSAVNIIPDKASIIVGFRPLPNTNEEEIIERIKKAALKNNQQFIDRISFSVQSIAPSMMCKADSNLEKIIKEFAKPKECAVNYATDAGNISKEGIECLIFGPGAIEQAHTANEWIYKKDLVTYTKSLQKIISKFLS